MMALGKRTQETVMRSFGLLIALFMAFALPAAAQTKRAFIVGVGDYAELPDLQKTLGDANGYRDVFESDLGFEVTHLADPGHIEFLEAFEGFLQSVAPGDEVVFIFSGHGWSDGADNFLALKDAPFSSSEFALKRQTVSLSADVMAELQNRQPALLFAIVDACRDNPFELGTKSVTRGLVRQEQLPGTLVVYAAGAGQKALDRLSPDDASPYSVFTRSLLPKLKDPNRPLMRAVEDAKNGTTELAQSVAHTQRPAVYTDVSIDYCFAKVSCDVGGGEIDEEVSDWVEISSTGYTVIDPCTKYQNYLNKWGETGKFAAVAKRNLASDPCSASRLKYTGAVWMEELHGHSDDIFVVRFSPDGGYIASASADHTLRYWSIGATDIDMQANKLFEGHTDSVFSVGFSPDGSRLVSGSMDGTARVWSIAHETEVFALEDHGAWVTAAEYSPDSVYIATTAQDGVLRLWDAELGVELWKRDAHAGGARSVRFSHDGASLVTAGNDGGVRVWDVETGSVVKNVVSLDQPASYAEFSADDDKIIIAASDGYVRIADGSGDLKSMKGHQAHLWNAVLSPDGEIAASSGADLSAFIWDAVTGAELGQIQALGGGGSNWMEFSPDGRTLASAAPGGVVSIYQLSFED